MFLAERHINNIAILGAGESGTGAAVLAAKKGIDVFVSDAKVIPAKYKNRLKKHNISFEEEGHDKKRILNTDLIVKSPGIPDDISILNEASENEITIISEIEFASWFTNAKIIAVTGSNGKTTTSNLIWHILNNAGFNVGLAGNIGDSFALKVAKENHEYYVLEISSFQLDGIINFKPNVAVLLNITPDHLDRYDNSFEKYTASKLRITENQSADDSLIYWADDEVIKKEIEKRKINAKLLPFSDKKKAEEGAWIENNKINILINLKPIQMTLEKLALQGRHNYYNSMAAGIASRVFDVRKDVVKDSLVNFKNSEHRLEYIMTVHGIEFINDSKATNVNATWYALETMSKPVVWIAGGVDKGNDYKKIKKLVKEKVKAIICLGEDNSKIREAFGDVVEAITDASTAKEAVEAAYFLAQSGDVVLLSPACASFDLFENYEERGRQVKVAVRNL